MASKIFPAILIAVVIWLGAQVWRDSSEGLRKAKEGGTPKASIVPESARPKASDFTLVSAQGQTVQLSSYVGKSPVIMEFFATW